MSEERMLTSEQVAERLQITVQTVQRWLRSGKLRGVRIGGRAGYRVPESEVARLFRESES